MTHTQHMRLVDLFHVHDYVIIKIEPRTYAHTYIHMYIHA